MNIKEEVIVSARSVMCSDKRLVIAKGVGEQDSLTILLEGLGVVPLRRMERHGEVSEPHCSAYSTPSAALRLTATPASARAARAAARLPLVSMEIGRASC